MSSYDHWLTNEPDDVVCSGRPSHCGCPECEQAREEADDYLDDVLAPNPHRPPDERGDRYREESRERYALAFGRSFLETL